MDAKDVSENQKQKTKNQNRVQVDGDAEQFRFSVTSKNQEQCATFLLVYSESLEHPVYSEKIRVNCYGRLAEKVFDLYSQYKDESALRIPVSVAGELMNRSVRRVGDASSSKTNEVRAHFVAHRETCQQ